MGLSAQSTIIQNVDVGVSLCETMWHRSLRPSGVGAPDGGAGELRDQPRPATTRPRLDQAPRAERYAPGHGPGVVTSGSCSTFVSKSLKPRRR